MWRGEERGRGCTAEFTFSECSKAYILHPPSFLLKVDGRQVHFSTLLPLIWNEKQGSVEGSCSFLARHNRDGIGVQGGCVGLFSSDCHVSKCLVIAQESTGSNSELLWAEWRPKIAGGGWDRLFSRSLRAWGSARFVAPDWLSAAKAWSHFRCSCKGGQGQHIVSWSGSTNTLLILSPHVIQCFSFMLKIKFSPNATNWS